MRDSIKYYHEIRNIFPLKDRKVKKFLEDIHMQIKDYDSSCPRAGYDMLVERFGTPQEVVTAYFGENPTHIIRSIRNKNYIKKAILISLSILAFISFLVSVYENKKVDDARDYVNKLNTELNLGGNHEQ